MTTRNFRVNNGLSVGDITISASANTITGLDTGAPSSDGDVANKKYVDDQASASLTLTNKTLTSPVLNTGISGTAIKDEDNMSSNSATHLATQQSIKAYVDTEVSAVAVSTIAANNSNVLVTDTGTNGTVTVTCDGNTELTVTDAGVRVHGNLTVDGTETILNTTTLSVEDNIIELNRNVSSNSATPNITGVRVNRGEGSTATEMALYWAWDETFADDGTTIFGGAGGAWTAFKAPRGDESGFTAADLVDIRANVLHATSTTALYADVAERFEADAPMTEGAVVTVGGSAEITETTSDLSDAVFGVVSTAPAYAMNAGAGNNESHPFVAMTGRTPVRVIGAVTKGQRLVSSSTKGCARAVAQGESITPFHVIGRALETSTDAGIKLVNCAVRTNN